MSLPLWLHPSALSHRDDDDHDYHEDFFLLLMIDYDYDYGYYHEYDNKYFYDDIGFTYQRRTQSPSCS